MALLAVIPAIASVQPDHGNQPFIGLWKLNIAKARAHLPPGFAVYRLYRDDGGGWISEAVITITPRGPRFLFTTARFDGKPYPDYTGKSLGLGDFERHGVKLPRTVTFTRVNAHQIRWTDKMHGQAVAGGTETVAPDGTTMTMTTHVPGRKVTSVAVYDRDPNLNALRLALGLPSQPRRR